MPCKPSCPRFYPAGEKSVRSCCALIFTQPGAARVLLVGDITRKISHCGRNDIRSGARVQRDRKVTGFKGGQLDTRQWAFIAFRLSGPYAKDQWR